MNAASGPPRLSRHPARRLALAADASHYALTPEAVAAAGTLDEVARVMAYASAEGRSVTFRSAGTSLSGQAVTDSVLLDTRRGFRAVEVLDDGQRVRVEPGAVLRHVNLRLARFGRRLGPDPASESACTLGGVLANNSSGMACGTTENSYRTVESLTCLLPDGTVLGTAGGDRADRLMRNRAPRLHGGLSRIRDHLRADPDLSARVRRGFAIKNTMGYGLNAFLDHDRPSDILTHLLIGSEGTLAFIGEAVLHTVAVRPFAATGLAVFPSLRTAAEAVARFDGLGADVVEILDATSLRVSRGALEAAGLAPGGPPGRAALLVEFRRGTREALRETTDRARSGLRDLAVLGPVRLTEDPGERSALWNARKGLYAAAAGSKGPRTTAMLEDVAVPAPALADACGDLLGLFDTHGYSGSVVFGHAKDGNLHFMLTEDFSTASGTARYARFTEEMADLVLGHAGTLKAEHGTGRVMAPFLRRQYGDALYGVMVRIKELFDPGRVLNPDVIITDDPEVHLKHLKSVPPVDAEVDRCVECGYCEPVCPSQDLTLTPRQRIVLRRAAARARQDGDTETAELVDRAFGYAGVDTCAADGMCSTACPLGIDTGALVKRLRSQSRTPLSRTAASVAAGPGGWRTVTASARAGLRAAKSLGPLAAASTRALRILGGRENVPEWSPDLPGPGTRTPPARSPDGARAVFFPSCLNRMFAPAGGGPGSAQAFLALCDRAGVPVVVPAGTEDLCCGTPWSSKGFSRGHERMAARVAETLFTASDAGRLPVVCDATSCTQGLLSAAGTPGGPGRGPVRPGALRFLDALQFVHDEVLDGLPGPRRWASVTVHPTCATQQLGLDDVLTRLAAAVADEVHVPVSWGCCGFAGDRGMLHPRLTASATAREAAEVRDLAAEVHASSNRPCEIGLSRASGREYRHVLELLEEATRPGAPGAGSRTTG